jgi:hypothetical protein
MPSAIEVAFGLMCAPLFARDAADLNQSRHAGGKSAHKSGFGLYGRIETPRTKRC